MLENNGNLETLKELGLTFSQAKVYLAAAKLGRANANDIWKESGVGRQEVYRILTEILELGLIEKEISRPTQFKPVELSKGLKILLNTKRKEATILNAKVRKIIKQNENNPCDTLKTQESQFIILPRKFLMENRGRYSYRNAKKTIDYLASFERLEGAFTCNLQVYNEAVKRDVYMRVITNKPKISRFEQLKKDAHTLFSKQTFYLKFAMEPVNMAISIIDSKEAYFALKPEKNIFEDLLLWTNNTSIISLAKEHFETTWNHAIIPEINYLAVTT